MKRHSVYDFHSLKTLPSKLFTYETWFNVGYYFANVNNNHPLSPKTPQKTNKQQKPKHSKP